ncbi:MAG: GNAT family N-acetyltransferase [Maritimibacter sp.]|nr:GNAT family N-acetyltransferase [Maritimibacter sp.]
MAAAIDFVRLTDIPSDEILAHMSDPRLADHMPLLTGDWDRARVAEFVAFKEGFWARDGLGHWAFRVDGAYVGWGGFQNEGGEWDFGLVLRPDAFGQGVAITHKALAFARADPRIPFVTFLLPPSRRKLGALKRLGAVHVGEIDYDGATFLKFRLDTV